MAQKLMKFRFEVGDPNYVAPGEFFAELTPDGKQIAAIYQRQDNLDLKKLVSETLDLEDDKTTTMSIAGLSAGDVEITPTTGKDAMKKVTITFTE